MSTLSVQHSIHTTNSDRACNLGPSLYCASVCYQTIASPLMLLVAFSMEGGSGMPQTELWALLGVATVVLLVGASLVGCYMVPEYRKTFYQVMWGTECV